MEEYQRNRSRLIQQEERFKNTDSITPAVAAAITGVSKRTIERALERGELEGVPKGKRKEVSTRSLVEWREADYTPTAHFNILEEVTSEK